MRGLVIQSPWIEKILKGQKTWEMRSNATGIRGEIALIKKGSGMIFGIANLKDTNGPLSETELIDTFDQHRIPSEFWSPFDDFKWRYAWILSEIKPLPSPVRYEHPPGAVIWVVLSPETTEAIQHSLSAKTAMPSPELQPLQPVVKSNSEPVQPLKARASNDFIRVPRRKNSKPNVLSKWRAFSGDRKTTEKVKILPDRKPASLYRKKAGPPKTNASVPVGPREVNLLPNKSQLSNEETTQGKNYREIALTQGNINNGHINLRPIKDWLPISVIGGSNKDDLANETMTIDWGGPSFALSDIAGDKMIFRSRKWVREFFSRHQLRAGDKVSFEQLSNTSLKVRPVKGVVQL